MQIVGLTGGIATGKSTAGRWLRDQGVPVLDADAVARAVVEPGSPALQAIVERFGPDALGADGGLDRAAMRARISADPGARAALEAITHPAIFARMAQDLADLAAAGHPVAVVEAALMVETGSYRNYPFRLVITCRPETQLARLVHRDGMDETAARQFIGTQRPLADKEAVATHLVHNDGTPEAFEAALSATWTQLLADAGISATRP